MFFVDKVLAFDWMNLYRIVTTPLRSCDLTLAVLEYAVMLYL